MKIRFVKALENALIDLKQPVVSDYVVFVEASKISRDNQFKDVPLHHQTNPFTRVKVLSLIRELKHSKVIRSDPDFPRSIYKVNEIANGTADEICCLVDPFCYISHLSAMQRYGLTGRIPATLIVTTPHRPLWEQQRDKRMQSEIEEFLTKEDYIALKQSSFPASVRKMPVQRHETQFPAVQITIRDSYARISDIGSTFADMLEQPVLCGGMEHVLDVWREHAHLYIEDIIKRISENPKKIVKVRAGYILDEILGIKDSRVEQWVKDAQRGSSRLLDPTQPFKSAHSEKWMLSLNV